MRVFLSSFPYFPAFSSTVLLQVFLGFPLFSAAEDSNSAKVSPMRLGFSVESALSLAAYASWA